MKININKLIRHGKQKINRMSPIFFKAIKNPFWTINAYYKFLKMKKFCSFFGGFAGNNFYYSLGLTITNYKNVSIGHRCSFGGNVRLHAHDKIEIGNDCMFGYGIVIATATHDYHIDIMNKSFITKSVTIGSNVWIGLNAIILPGITIGDGVVVGAGSIVTKDIPSYAIVAGNPAKIIKFRELKDCD